MLATALLSVVAPLHAAEPWRYTQELTPPAAAGYAPDDMVGFGKVVALSGDWLAVGVPLGYCATPAGIIDGGSVLLYRHDAATQRYVYMQQLCGTQYVTSIAMWDDWMLLGAPGADDTPGDGTNHGRVRFFRLDAATQQWHFVQGADGATDSRLGNSVAMDGGVATAGENGYNIDRGRVRTWRLATDGMQWIHEGWITPAWPTSRADAGEAFGVQIALDIDGCRAPACTAPHDTLIVRSRSGLHSIERLATGWGSHALSKPARGTVVSSSPVAVNGTLALDAARLPAGTADGPCAPTSATHDTAVVRVLDRQPGSAHLRSKGFACTGRIGIEPSRGEPRSVALQDKGSEFFLGIPDYRAETIGTVSTWDVLGNPASIQPTDVVADPDNTSAYHAEQPDFYFYDPIYTGDDFGASIAVQRARLAVGAPFISILLPSMGSGYVRIYTR